MLQLIQSVFFPADTGTFTTSIAIDNCCIPFLTYKNKPCSQIGKFDVRLIIKKQGTTQSVCPRYFRARFRKPTLTERFELGSSNIYFEPWSFENFFNINVAINLDRLDNKIRKIHEKFPLKIEIIGAHAPEDCIIRFKYKVITNNSEWFQYMRNDWEIPLEITATLKPVLSPPHEMENSTFIVDQQKATKIVGIHGQEGMQNEIMEWINKDQINKQQEERRKAEKIREQEAYDLDLKRILDS